MMAVHHLDLVYQYQWGLGMGILRGTHLCHHNLFQEGKINMDTGVVLIQHTATAELGEEQIHMAVLTQNKTTIYATVEILVCHDMHTMNVWLVVGGRNQDHHQGTVAIRSEDQ